jgi:hypothetical protein
MAAEKAERRRRKSADKDVRGELLRTAGWIQAPALPLEPVPDPDAPKVAPRLRQRRREVQKEPKPKSAERKIGQYMGEGVPPLLKK